VTGGAITPLSTGDDMPLVGPAVAALAVTAVTAGAGTLGTFFFGGYPSFLELRPPRGSAAASPPGHTGSPPDPSGAGVPDPRRAADPPIPAERLLLPALYSARHEAAVRPGEMTEDPGPRGQGSRSASRCAGAADGRPPPSGRSWPRLDLVMRSDSRRGTFPYRGGRRRPQDGANLECPAFSGTADAR
jgi:hypothetical protein